MFVKNLIRKRGVMIAVAIIALTTLTAGTVAATSNSAKFDAVGSVIGVGLNPGGTVGSDFDIKNGRIKSVTITTNGEAVIGSINAISRCKEEDQLSGTVCDDLGGLLVPSSVFSIHTSTAELKVSRQEHLYAPQFGIPIPVISGILKGELEGVLTIVANGDLLVGAAELEIKGTGLSSYACLLGVDSDFVTPVWGAIQTCIDSPGPNALGFYLDPAAGPVMVPLELHVRDSGEFEVTGVYTGVEIEGKLTVTVDSSPLIGTTGQIRIKKATVAFAEDD